MINKVKKQSKKRHEFIDDAIESFFRRVSGSQRKLNSHVIDSFLDLLDTENGRIKKTARNRKRINQSKFFDSFVENEGVSLLDNLMTKIFKVLGLNKAYFKLFSNKTDAIDKRVTKAILDSYGYDGKKYVEKGLLSLILKNPTIEQTLKGIAIASINQGATLASFRKNIKQYVLGDKDRLGAWESHFYTNTFDIFQETDRQVSDLYRNEIGLKYAIYQGGKVKGTRSFCATRDGNVYTEKEILSWNNLTWRGKKKNNFILRDAGGYNCRHTFDWISEELYNELK